MLWIHNKQELYPNHPIYIIISKKPRLAFNPYTQVIRTICTSEPVRSSTYLSAGFNLPTLRSIGFGSSTYDFGRAHPVPRPLRGCGLSVSLRLRPCGLSLAIDRNSLARYSKRTHGSCVHGLAAASFLGDLMRLIVSWFQALFTSLPRYFSAFAHATIALSVSGSI